MDTNVILTLTLTPVSIADADDTAGYVLQQGDRPASVAFHFTVPALVRAFNPQPDPPLPPFDRTVEDVVGFRFMQTEPKEEQGGGPGNPWGDLATLGKAAGDAQDPGNYGL